MRSNGEHGKIPVIWKVPSRFPSLGENDVHIWLVSLDPKRACAGEVEAVLNEQELQCSRRILRADARAAFLLMRAAVRVLAGAYAGCSPSRVAFRTGPQGKPFLSGSERLVSLRFNVSHSGRIGVCAFSRGGNVGVDVEGIRADLDVSRIARRFLPERECGQICAFPLRLRPAAFYACWTRKEAYLKALGRGLALELKTAVVSADPNRAEIVRCLPDDSRKEKGWTVRDICVKKGYRGAIVAEGRGLRLRHFRFPGSVGRVTGSSGTNLKPR